MPETWTGELIGKMHNEHVTYEELAAEMGCGKAYVSMILNGKRNPKDAKERLYTAYEQAIKNKKKED